MSNTRIEELTTPINQSQSYVPNEVFEVYVRAGASLLFISTMSYLIGCSDTVTCVSGVLGIAHEIYGASQNGWENTCAYTSEAAQVLRTKLFNASKAIKGNDWMNGAYTSLSNNASSLFNNIKTTIYPAKPEPENRINKKNM